MDTEIILIVNDHTETFNMVINENQDITDLLWEVRIELRNRLSKEKK